MMNRRRPGADTHDQYATREGKSSGVRPIVCSSKRILLVDSSSDAMAFMAFALRRHGHAVVQADGVQSAVTAASIQSFDIVVTNLVLPDGSGMTLLKMLREGSDIRGIALCDENGCDDHVILDAGFDFKLVKPVPIATLTHAVIALSS